MKNILRSHYHPALVGMLWQLGPLLLIASELLSQKAPYMASVVVWEVLVNISVAILAFLGGLSLFYSTFLFKVLSVGSLTLWLGNISNHLIMSPTLGLFVLSSYIGITSWILSHRHWQAGRQNLSRSEDLWLSILIPNSTLAIGIWLAVFLFHIGGSPSFLWASLGANVIAFLVFVYFAAVFGHPKMLGLSLVIFVLPFFGYTLFEFDRPLDVLSLYSVVFTFPGVMLAFYRSTVLKSVHQLLDSLFRHPEGAIILTFLFLCTIGSILLVLPASSVLPSGMAMIDAVFTAVSAVCVTGLIVVDTPQDLSALGQVFVLILIQLGGLGIMALSALASALIGRRLSVREEIAVTQAMGQKQKGAVGSILKRIIQVTVFFELMGTLVLSLAFLQEGDSLGLAFWRGLFTSISAFCNAGFSLFSDNLIRFQGNPVILHSVALLVIAGGLSPAFIITLPFLHRRSAIPLQARFIILGTLILLLSGMFFFTFLEWNQAFAHLGFWEKLNNAWFQSVTTRTAGFNTVDQSLLSSASVFISIALMFVGGAPGGTAGGIRVTTFMVFFMTMVSVVKGHAKVIAFNRRIPERTVYRAATIAAFAMLSGLIACIALLATQDMRPIVALFEVVSALSTVGLSLGGTAQLDQVGKIIIIICMFVGRVGSLSVIVFLSQRVATLKWVVPEEEVTVV
ncbi:MAG: hypothetical protein HYW48_06050 [Deltaproteobacteria bacterium]|nr:hypothetical protein [Deltaproteobacteria bacterium]